MFTINELQSINARNAKVLTVLFGTALSHREAARGLKLELNAASSDDEAEAIQTNMRRFYAKRRRALVYANALSTFQIDNKRQLKWLGEQTRTRVRSVKADRRSVNRMTETEHLMSSAVNANRLMQSSAQVQQQQAA